MYLRKSVSFSFFFFLRVILAFAPKHFTALKKTLITLDGLVELIWAIIFLVTQIV